MNKIPAKLIIVFIYSFFGILWIMLSDSVLLSFVKDIENLTAYQSYKGWAFIIVTSLLLYVLLLWYEKIIYSTIQSKNQIEKKFNLLYEDSPNPYQSLDSNGNIIIVNQKWLDMLGYQKDEVIGKWFGDMILPENIKHFKNNFTNFKANGSIKGAEYELVHKNGTIIPILLHGQIAYNTNHAMLQTHCSFENISDKINLEHLNKVSKLIRDINQAIVRIKDRDELLQTSCDILMSSDLYNYAWIEITQNEPSKLYHSSKEAQQFNLFKDKVNNEWTPPCINLLNKDINNFLYINDTRKFCNECPMQNGKTHKENAYVLELNHNNLFYGYLVVSASSDFNKDELELLEEVAGDIGYGIFNIETEEILKENEERYRFAIDGATDGLWDLNPINNKMYIAPRWKEILGYMDNQLKNSYETWESLIHPDDKEQILLGIKVASENQTKHYQYTYRLKHKDGHWVWINTRGQNIFDGNGNVTRMIGTNTDISELVKSKNELKISNEKFEKAFNNTPNIIILSNLNTGKIYDVNKTFETLFEYKKEEIIGKTTFDINLWVTKEDREKYIADFQKNTFVDGDVYNFNTKNENRIIAKVYASLITINNEEYILAVAEDITKKLALEVENKKLINVLDQNVNEVHLFNIDDFHYEYINKAGLSALGFTLDEMREKTPVDIVETIKSNEELKKLLEPLIDGRKKQLLYEATQVRKDSSQYSVQTILQAIEFSGVKQIVATVVDITDKKYALKQLQQKKDELEGIITSAPNPMILHEDGGKIIMLNQSWIDSSGFSLEDTPNLYDFIDKVYDNNESRVVMKKHVKSLYEITEKVEEGNFTFSNKNKEIVTWQFSSAPLGIVEGKRIIISSAMDITELKHKDEMLISQSRHAAMGEMIGMIAHQWRQPISVISMDANNMIADIELDEFSISSSKAYAENINEHVQHLSKTIDDFRNFFKTDKEISQVTIEEILEKTLNIVKDSLKNNSIELKSIFQTDKKVDVYTRELMQVFVNIITNSKDALVQNGIHNAQIDIKVFEDGRYINTEICDNGGGIDSKILPKIFDPYFSTKDEKTGTGLGLYMCKLIVEEHLNGVIYAKNNEHGACFNIKILKH